MFQCQIIAVAGYQRQIRPLDRQSGGVVSWQRDGISYPSLCSLFGRVRTQAW